MDTVNPFTQLKQLEGEIIAHYVATAFRAVHEGEGELYAALRALSAINKVNLFPYINGNLFDAWRNIDSFTPAAVSILRDMAVVYLDPK